MYSCMNVRMRACMYECTVCMYYGCMHGFMHGFTRAMYVRSVMSVMPVVSVIYVMQWNGMEWTGMQRNGME